MKVRQVLSILTQMDPEMDVAIEQIFREHRSIQLRSIEVVNKCVVFKDHTVCVKHTNPFVNFEGLEFDVTVLPDSMLPERLRGK
jgi:hypothetical protein